MFGSWVFGVACFSFPFPFFAVKWNGVNVVACVTEEAFVGCIHIHSRLRYV